MSHIWMSHVTHMNESRDRLVEEGAAGVDVAALLAPNNCVIGGFSYGTRP